MRLLLLALLVVASSASAQVLPPSAWWHESPNVFENAPTSHLFGGMAWNAFVRGPWIAKPFRNAAWKRVGVCAVGGAAWEAFQVLETKNYPARHGLWDFEASVTGCVVSEAVLALIHR